MLLLTLPHEIITHIFHYIPDIIPISMTCKLFQNLLDKICNQLKNINDPYFLSKNFDKAYLMKVHFITNHNCLNFITYKLFITKQYPIMSSYYVAYLLEQHCKINNVSRPEYINKMCMYFIDEGFNICEYLQPIMRQQMYQTSPDIILLIFRYLKSSYLLSIYWRLKIKTRIDYIFEEIDFFVSKNVLTYKELYKQIEDCGGRTTIHNNLVRYVTEKLKS